MTPPKDFADELKRYDPALRVRFGIHRQIWMIEERMPERHHRLLSARPNPWKGKRGLDLYDGWKDGYLHVLDVPPAQLHWNLVVPTLDWASVAAKRRLRDINDQLDAIEVQEEAARERATKNWVEAATSDAYDRLAWLQGDRVGWHEPAKTKLTPVEDHGGYLVTDRRAVKV